MPRFSRQWKHALFIAEYVLGIIFRLDCAQPVNVGSPIGGFPSRHVRIWNVDIGAIRPGLQRFTDLRDPGQTLRSQRVGRSGDPTPSAPTCAGLGIEEGVAVSEGRTAGGFTALYCPAERVGEEVAVRGWRLRHERFDHAHSVSRKRIKNELREELPVRRLVGGGYLESRIRVRPALVLRCAIGCTYRQEGR